LLKFEKQSDGRIEVYKVIPKGSQTETAQSSILEGSIVKTTAQGTKVLQDLIGRGIFDYAKPVELMKYLLSISTSGSDIVLDFFGGSGTLAHAVEELNVIDNDARRWIMVQLPELTSEESEAHKAGHNTIAEIARERMRRAGVKIHDDFAGQITRREMPLDLGFRSYALGDSNFQKWNELVADPEEIKHQTELQLNPIVDDAKDEDLLTEILLKRGISPLVEIEANVDFVFIPSESLAVSLSHNMAEELFRSILAKSPAQIILLDQAFNNDVNLKTNLILQAEKQGIVVEVL
jgi:adenine-specific DNA-methyltransferase